jgi:superfamily II DNA or RNA helicase
MDYVEYADYQSELKYLTTNAPRLAYIATLIDKIKESGNTLILVDRIETGKMLQIELSSLFSLLSDKPEVAFVYGNTKATDRTEQYDEIATSTNKIIIATYGVAAVGINIPRIFNLVLFEAGKSFVRVIQSIGRGIRKAEDKDFVQIWDLTSTCKFAKRHLTKRKAFYKDANYPFEVEKVTWK